MNLLNMFHSKPQFDKQGEISIDNDNLIKIL